MKQDKKIEDLEEQIKTLKDADKQSKKQLGIQQDEIESLKKDKNTLEKKLELLQTEMTTELAKEKLSANEQIKALETRMSKDFELKEESYRKTIGDLEKQVKEKEIIVEKEPVKPKTLKDKLLATIEVWFK